MACGVHPGVHLQEPMHGAPSRLPRAPQAKEKTDKSYYEAYLAYKTQKAEYTKNLIKQAILVNNLMKAGLEAK